jgi:hypothetical protein
MTNQTPKYAKSIEFLKAWKKSGYWVLTAIDPLKRGVITTDSFSVKEHKEALTWLRKYGSSRNIYFHVNSTIKPLSKKAEREDILSLDWLHVDLDPRIGEDLEEEQKRCLELLQNPPKGIPKPTVIIFSGGGYQGFWKLKEPIIINGEEEEYENAKRYNLQLELLFNADACHNVDRIMRLPGTVNRPNEKKIKRGRKPVRAELVEFNKKAVYKIEQFNPAPLTQNESYSIGSEDIKVSGNIARINIDDLPEGISETCKNVIVQGFDPDDPQRWPSRSEPLFWVCCEMVRAKCDNDLIYSVITDPDFGISESVLEKGSGIDKYAKKQIKTARDEAIDPKLRELNEKHAVIGSINGKCRIISEEPDETGLKRSRITFQTFNDFMNRYCHRKVYIKVDDEKTIMVPLGKWWINHKDRRDYDRLVFSPGREISGAYNLWKGFAYGLRPTGTCQKYLDHIRDHICCKNEELYNYLISWMAQGVQQPDQPGYTAIVLRGKRGVGKGVFAKTYGALFGRHFLQITNSKHLIGSFNAHLRDCVVLFADEAFYAGDVKHEALLKSLITEELMMIEQKTVDSIQSRNYTHIIMASNNDWVVPAGANERRFVVLDVDDSKMQNTKYFRELQEELDDGGYENLLYMLMNHDISKFDVRTVPKTAALQDQRIMSFAPDVEWWFHKLVEGEIFEGQGWPEHVFCKELAYDFTSIKKHWNVFGHKGSQIRFGRFILNMMPPEYRREFKRQLSGCHEVIGLDGQKQKINQPRVYMLPPLEECRAYFNELQGDCFKWDKIKVLRDSQKEEAF